MHNWTTVTYRLEVPDGRITFTPYLSHGCVTICLSTLDIDLKPEGLRSLAKVAIALKPDDLRSLAKIALSAAKYLESEAHNG